MMVPHWLDGREELRCLDEDESTHFRGLTFNYSPVYKIITVAVSASVSEFQTFHSLMMKCCERGARCSSKRQHCSLTLKLLSVLSLQLTFVLKLTVQILQLPVVSVGIPTDTLTANSVLTLQPFLALKVQVKCCLKGALSSLSMENAIFLPFPL